MRGMRSWTLLACLAACSHIYSTGDRPDAREYRDAPGTGTHDAPGDGTPLSPDFIVNTVYAGDQFLTNDFETVGAQLAATNDNNWTVVFRDQCTTCNLYGRRFDVSGGAVSTTLGGGTGQFQLSAEAASNSSIPAVAASGTTTLAVWDPPTGVACRSLDAVGNALAQVTLGTDQADVVTVSPLADGDFVVTWQAFITSAPAVRAMIVAPDCTTIAGPYTVSASTGATGAHRAQAAGNGAEVLYAWVVDGSAHFRIGGETGALTGTDVTLVPKSTLEVAYVRVVPWGNGFAVAVRLADPSGVAKGRIELYSVSTAGGILGGPYVVAASTGSDFASNKSFGLTRAYDEILMVTWHDCPAGAGSCDVFGRWAGFGGPLGPAFVVPSHSGADQINPSVVAIGSYFVVAWTDASGLAPDTSGLAVRASVIYLDRTLL